jgi:hypothetical protein
MKKLKNFQELLEASENTDRSKTDSYEPPKYVVQPAKGDKGFALLSSYMKKLKKIIEPGIWSS